MWSDVSHEDSLVLVCVVKSCVEGSSQIVPMTALYVTEWRQSCSSNMHCMTNFHIIKLPHSLHQHQLQLDMLLLVREPCMMPFYRELILKQCHVHKTYKRQACTAQKASCKVFAHVDAVTCLSVFTRRFNRQKLLSCIYGLDQSLVLYFVCLAPLVPTS